MLAVSLLFVGITLICNGALILQKGDTKSMAVMNIITAVVLVVGNFMQLSVAESMMDYCNVGAGFLFGFTYAIIACNLLFGFDGKMNGWFSLMVAIFAIVLGSANIMWASYNYAYLWFAWAILWGCTFVENILNKPLGKLVPILCIIEGAFAAFAPAMLMFFGMW